MRRVLTLIMVLTAMVVSAQTDVTVDGIKYILDGGTATVTYPNSSKPGSSNPNEYTGEIIIPPSISVDGTDYPVTAIGNYAFRYADITSLTLPEGLISIGKEAVYKTTVTEMTVPNSVTTLGESCLSQNSQLAKITFGEGCGGNWGYWVAWRPSGAYEVYMICDTKPTLADHQTFDDTHNSTIYVKNELYDEYMADPLWNIYNIVKRGVELIDFTVDGIKYKMITEDKVIVTYSTETRPDINNPNPYTGDIVIPAQVTYDGKTYNVTGIGDYAFSYASITSLALPEGIVSIGEEAIYNTLITELTLPNSLTSMGTYAMGYNSMLTTVTFGQNIATNPWGAWVLYRESPEYDIYMDCHSKPTVPDKYTFDHGYASRIHVYPDVYDAFLADQYWGGKYTIIPDMGGSSITFIEFTVDGIKYKMTAEDQVSVVYPNDSQPSSSNPSTYTGDIVIPAQVTYDGTTYNVTGIGNYAFRNSSITSITLPEGLISIGKEAIYKTQITEVTVPNSVTTLGESCLSENQGLQTITFGEHIGDKKWGVWVAWRFSGGYDVYMICDVMPTLPDNQTFDDSHESTIHVYPSLYLQYKANDYWNCHNIVADLLQDISHEDLQNYIADYSAQLPADGEVGNEPGYYTSASVQALREALTFATSLDENATLEQRNKALLDMIVAANGLQVNPLNEGYYYIENVYVSSSGNKYLRSSSDGYIAVKSSINESEARYFFKLTRKGSNWYIQSADENKKYFGAPDGEGWVTMTDNPDYEQIITWLGGGFFKIQCLNEGTASNPYAQSSGYVIASNYGDDNNRIQWRFHPVQSGRFEQNFNIENIRVREYMAEVSYTTADETKIKPYNVAPPVRRDTPEPVTLFWTQEAAASATALQVTWSTNADFSDAFTAEVDPGETYYEIFNLLPGQTYYYKVEKTVEGNTSEIINSNFTTIGQVRQIKAEGGGNMRDLGGWATAIGQPVKYGLIYRGAEWNGKYNLTQDGVAALRSIGMKAELDLRTSNEALYITQSPLGDDVTYLRINNVEYYEGGLQNQKPIYKNNLQFIFDCVKNDKPVFFHCHIGADRTGTLAFLIEGLLGVSESDIYKDYELTTFSYFETHRYKENVVPMIEYINTLEGETLTDKFYTYCHTELGLTAKEIADFRMKMLGKVYPTDIRNVVAEAVSEKATSLDLSDYVFESEALTENMPSGSNLLVTVAPETGITGQNIINNGVCENLVLTDGVDFGTSSAFTASQVSFTTNVKSYKTLVLPFETEVPEGFTISRATSVTGTSVNVEAINTISAGKPVLIQGEGSLELTATNAEVAATDEASLVDGVLYGTYKGTFAPIDSYVLQNQSGVIGFYKVADQIAVGAFRAYLNVAPSGVKAFYFREDDPTSIQNPEAMIIDEGDVFDLSGRKVNSQSSVLKGRLPKGVYITNGKKLLK